MQFKEALVPAMAFSSWEGGRNVQLFRGCLCVGLAGCSALLCPRGRLQFQWVALPSKKGPPVPHVSSLGEAAPVSSCGNAWLPSPAPLSSSATLAGGWALWAWVMGKISRLPPFPLCGAAVQSLRLGHVLISQDRDALWGIGRYPTHSSLMLCLSSLSSRKDNFGSRNRIRLNFKKY